MVASVREPACSSPPATWRTIRAHQPRTELRQRSEFEIPSPSNERASVLAELEVLSGSTWGGVVPTYTHPGLARLQDFERTDVSIRPAKFLAELSRIA